MYRRIITVLTIFAIAVWMQPHPAAAQQAGPADDAARPSLFIPSSSIDRSSDLGKSAHTNYLIRITPAMNSGVAGETPETIRSVYQLPGDGGKGAIAIVDAYHDPNAIAELNSFSSRFGLPRELGSKTVFEVVYGNTVRPKVNSGWNVEEALDIEWAHAMAPRAKIYLVEAASATYQDLFSSVRRAVAEPLVAEVSMSWSGDEFPGEIDNEKSLRHKGVVFFASTGDSGAPAGYPAVSPNVVAAGGTTINRDSEGRFIGETGWSGSGGGPSLYESIPTYQSEISPLVGAARGAPDMSFDADPTSGVAIYSVAAGGWIVVGGTSVSSPCLNGIANLSGRFAKSTLSELTAAYSLMRNSSYFYDVVLGNNGYSAGTGWDFVTGIGAPRGLGAL